ncbi:hypothetical protein SDC9_208848 [bioreactor metagenome]|uniref:Uncharacterized protein n=1 Tax=bioreactor metagenome TaxID=1076179 RepID=A0A645JLB7_9ZZZZ
MLGVVQTSAKGPADAHPRVDVELRGRPMNGINEFHRNRAFPCKAIVARVDVNARLRAEEIL